MSFTVALPVTLTEMAKVAERVTPPISPSVTLTGVPVPHVNWFSARERVAVKRGSAVT